MKNPQSEVNEKVLERIYKLVDVEFRRASNIHPKFNTPHEGFYIIHEEYDELDDEVKKLKSGNDWTPDLVCEAIQLSAMCIRFLHDCCRLERDL